jgi:hypothetical protein
MAFSATAGILQRFYSQRKLLPHRRFC